MQLKRLVYFLFINILVSTVTTLIVLTVWDQKHQAETSKVALPTPLTAIPTATQAGVAQVETEATPQISMQVYQISEGETLGEIAFAFGIEVEELLELNGLTDPDSIGAGTTIFVPVPDGAAPGSDSGLGGLDGGNSQTNLPAEPGGLVEIVRVIGAGDLASERVQLRGKRDVPISLAGWRLQDEDSNIYTFPQITLFGGGAVNIYTAAGVDTVVALYWNSGEAIWETGERAAIFDDTGQLQATFTVP